MRFERVARLAPAALAPVAALALLGGADLSRAAEVVERILAVVDGRPVLLSEVRVMERVTGRDAARALEALIDEQLMFREAARLPQAAVSEAEEGGALQSLRARMGAGAEGVPERDLRQLARRQAVILKYVGFRFQPQVRVEEEAVRRAYEEAYGQAEERPPYEEAEAELRRRLADRELDERIEAWVRELRSSAEIRYNRPPPRPPDPPAS